MSSFETTNLHRMRPATLVGGKVVPLDGAAEMDKVLGDLSDIHLFGEQVLIGVYIRGEVMPSGLIVSGTVKEDMWQGKVARVLKIGPMVDCLKLGFGVGDWVFHRAADGLQMFIAGPDGETSPLFVAFNDYKGGWPCRLVYAADIYGRLTDPNIVV